MGTLVLCLVSAVAGTVLYEAACLRFPGNPLVVRSKKFLRKTFGSR